MTDLEKLIKAITDFKNRPQKIEPFLIIPLFYWVEEAAPFAYLEDLVYGIDDTIYLKSFSYHPGFNEDPHIHIVSIEYEDLIRAIEAIKPIREKRNEQIENYLHRIQNEHILPKDSGI